MINQAVVNWGLIITTSLLSISVLHLWASVSFKNWQLKMLNQQLKEYEDWRAKDFALSHKQNKLFIEALEQQNKSIDKIGKHCNHFHGKLNRINNELTTDIRQLNTRFDNIEKQTTK